MKDKNGRGRGVGRCAIEIYMHIYLSYRGNAMSPNCTRKILFTGCLWHKWTVVFNLCICTVFVVTFVSVSLQIYLINGILMFSMSLKECAFYFLSPLLSDGVSLVILWFQDSTPHVIYLLVIVIPSAFTDMPFFCSTPMLVLCSRASIASR